MKGSIVIVTHPPSATEAKNLCPRCQRLIARGLVVRAERDAALTALVVALAAQDAWQARYVALRFHGLMLLRTLHGLQGQLQDLQPRYDALAERYHQAQAALTNKAAVRKLATQIDTRR